MSDMKQLTPAQRRLHNFLGEYWIVFVFLVIYLIFVIIEPLCFTLPFLASTLNYMTEILILGVGVMFVVITAGIDLSIGPVEGAVGVGAALVMKALIPVFGTAGGILAGVIVGIAMGMIIGMINGLVITKLKLAPFIATLGMSVILTGTGYILNNGIEVVGLPRIMGKIGNHTFFNFIGTTTIIAWAIWFIFGIILKHTRFGVITYAYGSNAESTKRAGINVDKHIMKVYMISSTLAAISGVMLIFRFNTGIAPGRSQRNTVCHCRLCYRRNFGSRWTWKDDWYAYRSRYYFHSGNRFGNAGRSNLLAAGRNRSDH